MSAECNEVEVAETGTDFNFFVPDDISAYGS